MSLPKTNKQTKIPWLPSLKGHLIITLYPFIPTQQITIHLKMKRSVPLYISAQHWVYKKKKDTKCFVEGLSEQTVKREKWRECSPDHLGLSKVLKTDMEFLKTNRKHQLTWDMALHSPTAILPSSSIFSFGEKSPEKRSYKNNNNNKMEQQSYAETHREVSCPFMVPSFLIWTSLCITMEGTPYFT